MKPNDSVNQIIKNEALALIESITPKEIVRNEKARKQISFLKKYLHSWGDEEEIQESNRQTPFNYYFKQGAFEC